MRKISEIWVFVITAVFLLSFCGISAADSNQKTLKIGVLFSFTGTGATYGASFIKVLRLQAKLVNLSGGLTVGRQRYRIKLVTGDDKTTAAGGRIAFEKLVYQDKIKFMVGTALGASAVAIAPIREEAKVLTMDCSSTPKMWIPSGKFAFKPHVMIYLVEPILFRYVVNNYPNVRRYALLGANDASGRAVYSGFQMGLKSLKDKTRIDLVSEKWFERGTREFTPILTSLLRSRPDAIDVCGANSTEAILIIKQARDLGYKGMFVSTYALTMDMLRKECSPKYIHGIVMAGLDWENPPTKEARKFVEEYKAEYKEMPGPEQIYIVDHLPLLLRGIQLAKSTDPEVVVKEIASWKNFPTITGNAIGWGGKKTFGWKRQIERPWPLIVINSATESHCVLGPAVKIP